MGKRDSSASTVIGQRRHQLWLEHDHGRFARVWAPHPSGVRDGSFIRLYLSSRAEADGWYDPGSGQAVIQWGYDARDFTIAGRLKCGGRCGWTWVAPAPRRVLELDPRCLECQGPLDWADPPSEAA